MEQEKKMPRFTAVEVEGGWSVLDQWENERHKNVGTRENTETTLRMLADGRLTKQQGSGWIPYVPAPKEPTPRYIEIAVEGGKSIYDTVTKQRRHHIWFNDDELKEVLDKWNDGMMGNPNDRGSKFLWIPHELPAPGPQYIACQHKGKWEGDFWPDRWGVCRVADDHWCEACEDSKESAMNLVDGINNNNGQFTNWRWYRRRVVKRAGVPVPAPDMVNHPPHYTHSDIECIDAIRAALGKEWFLGFCCGNAMKYHWRAGLKVGETQEQDLAKAAWYSQMAAHVADPERNQDPRNTGATNNG